MTVFAPISTARADCGNWTQVTAVTGTINYSYSHTVLIDDGANKKELKWQWSGNVSFPLTVIARDFWSLDRDSATGPECSNDRFTTFKPREPPEVTTAQASGSPEGGTSGGLLTFYPQSCEYAFTFSTAINTLWTQEDGETHLFRFGPVINSRNRPVGDSLFATLNGSAFFPIGSWSGHEFHARDAWAYPEPGGAEVSWTFKPVMDDTLDDPCRRVGSLIACENQSLAEQLQVTGTPYALHYQSERTQGYHDANAAAITLAQGLGGWTLNIHHAYDPVE